MRTVIILILAVLFSSFNMKEDIPIVDFEGLEPLLNTRTDTTYVVNFWATWCIPCVRELPVFEDINNKYQDQKVKVVLVSLDFPGQLNSKVIPFLEETGIRSEVILLADPNSNMWIDKVSPDWSGSIPATLIYNKNSRQFFEQSFEFGELDEIISGVVIK